MLQMRDGGASQVETAEQVGNKQMNVDMEKGTR